MAAASSDVKPADKPAEEKKEQKFLPNRPGEPDFKLEVTPEAVLFVCTADKRPVWCDLKLKNTTSDKHSFKVKCTSADHFRVQPPLGFVKQGEVTTVRVWFQNKAPMTDPHKHYFAIYHMKCAEGKSTKEIWTKTAKPEGVCRLLAIFEKAPEK